MITRRRTAAALCASVAAAVLAGCAAPAPAPLPTDPFAAALVRLDGRVRGYVEFVDPRVLAAGAGAWSDAGGAGSLAMYADRLAERLRIEVRRADWTSRRAPAARRSHWSRAARTRTRSAPRPRAPAGWAPTCCAATWRWTSR